MCFRTGWTGGGYTRLVKADWILTQWRAWLGEEVLQRRYNDSSHSEVDDCKYLHICECLFHWNMSRKITITIIFVIVAISNQQKFQFKYDCVSPILMLLSTAFLFMLFLTHLDNCASIVWLFIVCVCLKYVYIYIYI